MKVKLTFLAASAILMSTAVAEVPKTATEAAAVMQQRGAALFLSGLSPDEVDQLYEHFDNGEAEWLPLVPKLAGAADGANAEGLTISMAFALPKNPRGVLSLVTEKDGVLGVGRVCSMPFIEDTEPAGYRDNALAAVRKVTDAGLRRVKRLCLRALNRGQ
jgi:hypothetical protein